MKYIGDANYIIQIMAKLEDAVYLHAINVFLMHCYHKISRDYLYISNCTWLFYFIF